MEEDSGEPDPEVIRELRNENEELEKEMAISQRVEASTLEEVNLGMSEDPRLVSIAKEFAAIQRKAMVELLEEY